MTFNENRRSLRSAGLLEVRELLLRRQLGMHEVNCGTHGVAGVLDGALTDAKDRGGIAASSFRDGAVGLAGGQEVFDLRGQGGGSHVHAPLEICTVYALPHNCQRINGLFPYAQGIGSIASMQKSTIQHILAALLAEHGISPTELSRRTGVGQSTISRILNGKIATPKDEQVYPIAKYFGLSTDQLRGRVSIGTAPIPAIVREPEATMDGPIEVWDDSTPLPSDEVLVPFLKEVELAAGSGKMSVEVNSGRSLRFGKYSLKKQGVDPANARCVTITGNSMEPVLRNGATVGVDVGNTRIVDGDLYAINHGGLLRVKQTYRLPGGGIRLRSFNRDEHPDEEYSQDEIVAQEIEIIGRVFWGAMFF